MYTPLAFDEKTVRDVDLKGKRVMEGYGHAEIYLICDEATQPCRMAKTTTTRAASATSTSSTFTR